MASTLQSPLGAPPPAPKPKRGLMKNFNGSMLLLVSKSNEIYETNDPDKKGRDQNQNGGGASSRGSSFFRASDLFSQGRSSASSFGSRGSFSGWFPARSTSVPLEEQSEPSPINSPAGSRTSRSRSIAEDNDTDKERASSSSFAVNIRKSKSTLSKKLRNPFVKRPSNLGKKEQYLDNKQQVQQAQEKQPLPSYITFIAPASTPVRVAVSSDPAVSHTIPSTPLKQEPREDLAEITFTSVSTSTPITRDNTSYQKDIVSPKGEDGEGESETEEKAKDTPVGSMEETDDFNMRNDLLRMADVETIDVLTSRIGDRTAAKTVVRVARAGEAWMREDASRLQCLRDMSSKFFQPSSPDGEPDAGDDLQHSCLFYGEKRPKIALDRYLGRLVRYLDAFTEGGAGVNSMGILCLLGGVVLIDRMAENTNFNLDSMNAHRVFMIATLTAFKMLDDEPCSNEYYANVGGVELAELNMLEATFLKALKFNTHLSETAMRSVMGEFFGDTLAAKMFASWYENH